MAGSRILSLKNRKCAEFCRNSESLLQLHRFLICHIPIQGNGGVREFLRSLATASFRLSCESTHIVFHPMPRIIKPKVNQSMGNSNVKKYFSYWCGPSTSHWQMNRFKSTCFAKKKKQLKKRDLVPEHTLEKKNENWYPNVSIQCYCWWKKSCTAWDGWNPMNSGIIIIISSLVVSRILSINQYIQHLGCHQFATIQRPNLMNKFLQQFAGLSNWFPFNLRKRRKEVAKCVQTIGRVHQQQRFHDS